MLLGNLAALVARLPRCANCKKPVPRLTSAGTCIYCLRRK